MIAHLKKYKIFPSPFLPFRSTNHCLIIAGGSGGDCFFHRKFSKRIAKLYCLNLKEWKCSVLIYGTDIFCNSKSRSINQSPLAKSHCVSCNENAANAFFAGPFLYISFFVSIQKLETRSFQEMRVSQAILHLAF